MKIVDYQVVSGFNEPMLGVRVMKAINDGWHLHAGISLAVVPRVNDHNEATEIFSQAMVKYEEDAEIANSVTSKD